VASGVVLGTYLATRRARQRGVDLDLLNSFITWMLVGGFAGAHMFDEIFYHPHEIVKRPWSLLLLWEGLSSFGGFLGAILGVLAWKYFEAEPFIRLGPIATIPKFKRRAQPMPILALADLIASVFPVAWILGRSGCTVVHDHPGARASADALFAVAYGPVPNAQAVHRIVELGQGAGQFFIELRHGTAPQYDLGLLELMFTTVLSLFFALTWAKRLPTGTYLIAIAFAYPPVRLVMDFLRIKEGESADLRYGSLTFAQWSCIALFLFGFVLVRRVRDIKASGKDPMDLVLRRLPKAPKATDEPPLVA
jgi:phosphatidylglycerol:prolipoprotein diacylglycerol transferase